MTGGNRVIPIEQRLMRWVEQQPDGCWLWTGALSPAGYAQIRGGRERGHRLMFAHRLSWELFTGSPIPDGLTLDHLCRRPACVNPLHLEPVTNAENVRRAGEDRRRERTSCVAGHPDGPNSRYSNGCCRACLAERRKGLHGVPAHTPHGLVSTYSNYGCRCDPCKAAMSNQNAKRNRRASQHVEAAS